jgi:MFS family permease
MNNANKLYLFSFFYMFLVILPVVVPFFIKLGLSMHEIYQLQAIFGLAVVIFEVPTGYLCDLWGRKRTLIVGSLFSGLGFTYLLYVQSFWELVIYEVIVALALSFISGADVSLLYDSIDKTEQKHGTKSLANMQLFSMSGESVAAILGGFLVIYSFRHVLIAHASTGWVPFFVALTFHEPAYKKMDQTKHWENLREVFRHIFFNQDKLLLLIFINLTVWGLSTFFAIWMLQKYWDENGVALASFGIIWAVLNLTVGIAGKQVHWLEHKFGPIPLLRFLGLGPIVGDLGMGIFGGAVGVSMGIFFYLSRGITHVLLKDALNWRTPSVFRATANSLQSLFFRLGFAVFGPGVGYLIDRTSVRFTLMTLGAVFFGLFALVLIPMIKMISKTSPKYIPEE